MKRLYSTFVSEDQEKHLVVADLHIGFEWEHITQGVSIPQDLSQQITHDLIKVLKQVKADKIILLGDIEHSWSDIKRRSLSKYQYFRLLKEKKKSVKYFFSTLIKFLGKNNMIVIRGNHDITIGTERFPISLKLLDEIIINKGGHKINLSHGHKFPTNSSAKEYIFAHIHPSVQLLDPTGLPYFMPTLLYTEMPQVDFLNYIGKANTVNSHIDENATIIVKILPPFNEFIIERFGNPVNFFRKKHKYKHQKKIKTSFLNKIIRNYNTEVYLANGTYLGLIDELNYDLEI